MVSETTDLACLNFLNTMTKPLDSWRMESMWTASTLTLQKPIGIMCHQLRGMGISEKLGIWVHNFLSDKKQFIIANGGKSEQS